MVLVARGCKEDDGWGVCKFENFKNDRVVIQRL